MDFETKSDGYDHEKTIQMYDKMVSGKVDSNGWAMYLIDLLENYMKSIIKSSHFASMGEYDDLMQAGRLAVLEKANEYDPRLSRPTSYFTEYIKERMRETITPGKSKYYAQTGADLIKVAKSMGFRGLDDPNLDIDTLALLSGKSLSTINEVVKQFSQTVSSYEECSDNLTLESKFVSPEEYIIKMETKDELASALKRLTPLEQYLLIQVYENETGKKSLRYLISELKKPELAERFKNELPENINQNMLQQRVNHAYSKIKRNPSVAKYFEQNVGVFEEFEEQASEEDIDKAIMSGTLNL